MAAQQRAQVGKQAGLKGDELAEFTATGKISHATRVSVPSESLRTSSVPSTRIQGAAGDDMELHPRPVDVTVERPLGETLGGKDAQLEAAVSELLKQLGAKPQAH